MALALPPAVLGAAESTGSLPRTDKPVELIYAKEQGKRVAQRIVRLAEIVGRENLVAGSDCGSERSSDSR
ncbi:MAG: hypothetical protein ACREU3_13600 [Steroidobacteraceae bacterium]